MQVSSVYYQRLNKELRLDAEYYRKDILQCEKTLGNHLNAPLSELVDFIVGPFGSTVKIDKYVEASDYRYIRNKDVEEFWIKAIEPALIPEKVFSELTRYHIREQDLLLTVVGTLGKVAIATQADTKSIFSCKSTLLRAKKINPYFLAAYLNSTIGRKLCLRGKRGVIQEGLNLSDLKDVKVLVPSNNFQSFFEDILTSSFSFTKRSGEIFSNAQSLLLSELGLLDWRPRHRLWFVKDYSDTVEAERFDAEYFQPKYEEIIDAIQSYPGGWDTLGNLVKVKKCVEVGSDEYLDEGIPFLRVSNLTPHETTEEKYISQELYNKLKQYQPKQGEILLSKDGSPGIAHCLRDKPKKMIPSGGILRLSVKSDKVNGDFLTLVLNSILTKQQIQRDVGGSIILHWRPDQVKKLAVPILKDESQREIQGMVQESFALRKRSKHLLECAKRAVEIAIEQNEQTAEAWLDEIIPRDIEGKI